MLEAIVLVSPSRLPSILITFLHTFKASIVLANPWEEQSARGIRRKKEEDEEKREKPNTVNTFGKEEKSYFRLILGWG